MNTPRGAIHQKKENRRIEEEGKIVTSKFNQLKTITQKLIDQKSLDETDTKFLADIDIEV